MVKIKKLSGVLLGIILAFCVCGVFTACADETPATEEAFLVVVEGGSGGGYYYKDTNCTVTAEVPLDKQFMKWTSADGDLSANETYTFTVSGDIKLTAVFADAVGVPEIYTVNVQYGTGSGIFFAGTVRTLKVDGRYQNLDFAGWQLNGGNGEDRILSTEREYELTVTGDMNITALFDNTKFATPDNSAGNYFRIAGNGAYEFERIGGQDGGTDEFGKPTYHTSFKEGVSHLLFRTYDGEDNCVSSFIIARIPGTVVSGADRFYSYIGSADGSLRQNLKGALGNMYQDVDAAKAKIREIIGVQAGNTYCFTVQIIAEENTPYISSDESVKSPGRSF